MLNRCLNRSLFSFVCKVNHDKMFCQQSVGVGSSPDIVKIFVKYQCTMHIGCCSVPRAAGAGGGAAVFISAGLNDTDNVESRRVQPPVMQLQCSSAPSYSQT